MCIGCLCVCVCVHVCVRTSLKKALSLPQGGDLAGVPSLSSQFSELSQYFGPAPTNMLFSCRALGEYSAWDS